MEGSHDLNKTYVEKLFPNLLWMCVCLIIGTVGNILVLLVYGLRMKTKLRNERYFIPALAVFDLLSSIFSSIQGILHYLFFVNYPSDILCKIFNFGSFFPSAISAHTLLLIAIQRYRKICVPLGKQMDLFWKRATLVITIVICLSYSLPVYFTAGMKQGSKKNMTIYSCSINSGEYPLFYKIYYSGIFLMVLSNIVAVTVLYSRIACLIYRHSSSGETRTHKAVEQHDGSKDLHETTESNFEEDQTDTHTFNTSQCDSHVTLETISLKQLNKDTPNTSTDARTEYRKPRNDDISKVDEIKENIPTIAYNKHKNNSKARNMNSKWNRTKVNFNKLFGVILIFYLLAYVPTMMVLVVTSFGGFKDLDRNVFYFLNRLYIVNHIVNPFVYGYFDFCFRNSIKSLLYCKRQHMT